MPFFLDHRGGLKTIWAEDGTRLRIGQLGAVWAAASHFTVSSDPIQVVLPTGVGKTAVMTLLPFLIPTKRALVATPSRLVRDQSVDELIDCPPNLGLITLNGLRISHGYIIPTIPDVLSTYGIPQITSRVGQFSEAIGETIDPLGIVICKYRAQSTTHQDTRRRLTDHGDLRVFESVIPEANAVAAAAEFLPTATLKQKYQYQGGYKSYEAVADELIRIVEGE